MIKTTKQYAIDLNLDYQDTIWISLRQRDVIFGFIPINSWCSRSLPSKDASFLRKYLTDDNIKKINKLTFK
jgi:hypothetical protein